MLTQSINTYVKLFAAIFAICCVLIGALHYIYFRHIILPREVVVGIAALSAFGGTGFIVICSLVVDFINNKIQKRRFAKRQ